MADVNVEKAADGIVLFLTGVAFIAAIFFAVTGNWNSAFFLLITWAALANRNGNRRIFLAISRNNK